MYEEFYNEVLDQNEEKNKILNISILVLIVLAIVLFYVFLLIEKGFDSINFGIIQFSNYIQGKSVETEPKYLVWMHFLSIYTFVYFLLARLILNYLHSDFQKIYKRILFKHIFQGSEWIYETKEIKNLTLSLFSRSGLFNWSISNFEPEDQFQGTIADVPFRLTEVELYTDTIKVNKNPVRFFRGLFFVCSYPEPIDSQLHISIKNFDFSILYISILISFSSLLFLAFFSIFFMYIYIFMVLVFAGILSIIYIYKSIKSGNLNSILSDSLKDKTDVSKDKLMKIISNFQKNSITRIRINIQKNNLYIAVPFFRNLFEPSYFRKCISQKEFEEYVKLMNFIKELMIFLRN